MHSILLVTSLGNITVELDADKASNTVANFLTYVREGFYDWTIFHRVIPGFMIQGGGLEPGMEEKESHPSIEHEGNNGLSNTRGSIAMARTNDPHSASSQFFINTRDNAFLDYTRPSGSGWGYTVFGKVIEGMEVVDAIEASPTHTASGHADVPVEDITIISAEIL